MVVAPELVADSFGEYVQGVVRPAAAPARAACCLVIVGLILISIIFQTLNSKFLTAGNLVNLLVQGAVFILLAMAEVFALLLGEIDLSAGYVGGIAGIVVAELLTSQHGSWPWWAACLAGLAICALHRRSPGHDHHPPQAAVVRRHAGSPGCSCGRA